jgi:hypothetical protein
MKIGGSGNNQAGFAAFLVAKLMCAPRRGRDAGTANNNPLNGGANNPQIEAEIAAWYGATSLEEEKIAPAQPAGCRTCPYAPLGVMLQHQAWRKNVSGIVQAPLPLFWGVSKTA